jgi:hypothetical protein
VAVGQVAAQGLFIRGKTDLVHQIGRNSQAAFIIQPISYRSIVPKRLECSNLFVPVCLSATHIAYGSIRMEPVFMILAQSAATAASLAIDEGVPVQQVPYPVLKARLLTDKQVLAWRP